MKILKLLLKAREQRKMVQNLNPHEVKGILDSEEKVRLIDVRENWEHKIARIEGCELFPLSKISSDYPKLGKEEKLVIYCHHGNRSLSVCHFLVKQGYTNIINLRGGIAHWGLTVDLKMKQY